MQVAGVQPGTTVEWEVTIEDRGRSDFFSFRRHMFANSLPVAAEAVFVTGTVAALPSELAHGHGLKKIRTAGLAAWIAPPKAAMPAEAFAVPVETRCPMLWLGGEAESWAKVGNDYLKQLEDRLTVEEPVKQLAAALVAGKSLKRDRIAAIARHVQQQIGYTATEQRAKAQNILAKQGAVQLHEFRFENLNEIGEPARLTLGYAVRDGINARNGRHSGVLPALWEHEYLDTQFMKDRTTTFEWIYPLHFTSEVTIKLPAPAEAEALAALTRQAQSEFGNWSLKPDTRGNVVVLHFDFAAKAGTYPAARYAAFHESRDGARRVWAKPLSWRTK